jgi:hypothetical protein
LPVATGRPSNIGEQKPSAQRGAAQLGPKNEKPATSDPVGRTLGSSSVKRKNRLDVSNRTVAVRRCGDEENCESSCDRNTVCVRFAGNSLNTDDG